MHTEQSIIERLETLERQNRRMKRIGAGVILTVASLLLMAQTAPTRIVEANGFVLKDSSGRIRAKLEVSNAGNPILNFMSTRGDIRMSLSANDGGGGITLLGPNGQNLSLALAPERANLVMIRNGVEDFHLGHGRITTKNARTGEVLYDGEAVTLGMYSQGGSLDLEVRQSPSITIFDKEGFSAVLGSGPLETERTGETSRTSAASLILFGKDFKALWRAP